jgi:hypothetical protein
VGPGDGLYAGCFVHAVLRVGGPTDIFDTLEKRKSLVPVGNRFRSADINWRRWSTFRLSRSSSVTSASAA